MKAPKVKQIITLVFFSILFHVCLAQTYQNPNASTENRVEDLLQNLSFQEKMDYIGGKDAFYIRAISRLGLPELKMSDGPVGVRTWGNATAYPAGILNASTWNTALVSKLGQSLGEDARARGVHVLLGPGLNIYRAPLCGRNFEYFGEDPYLAANMAKAFVIGVQSKNVVSTIKHFAGNNQEWDRYDVSSDIDERTLHEIYFPAFKAAVTEAHAGAIMTAYNLLNGIWCSQNHYLITDVLKTNWKFDGIVMSDWGATHNGPEAAAAGLDLEMPAGDNMNYNTLLPLFANGSLSEAQIDDKVKRILRILFRFGFYDRVQLDTSILLDDSLHALVSLNLAREGIVLLKNADSLLPLDPSKIKSLTVIGPNADTYVTGGGSSYTSPFHFVSMLSGIKGLLGSGVSVLYDNASPDPFAAAANSVFYTDQNATIPGLNGMYYPDQNLSSSYYFGRVDVHIDFHWNNQAPISDVPPTKFSVRWLGYIKPETTCDYDFIVRGDDGFRLWVNDQQIINDWQDQSAATKIATIHLVANTIYPVKLEYYQNLGLADITFGWQPSGAAFGSAVQKAGGADAVIVCVGFNSNTEGEGFDRTFELPGHQDSLIKAVAKVNQKIIVVINAGGNVETTSWLASCKALLHAWYPGQEGGTAVAEILFGKTNPSGKLPASFEKKWADNPVYNNYYDQNTAKHINYAEGLLLGYRYYDTKNVDPLFPFGYGLSYTQFQYSNLTAQVDTSKNNGIVDLKYQIKNIGSRAGAEVSQIYVQPVNPSVFRPLKELKSFNKVWLLAGETKTISLRLDSSSFSYYKLNIHDFGMEYGSYNLLVGSSSRDIRLQKSIILADKSTLVDMTYSLLPENHASDVRPLQDFRFISDHPVYFDTNKSLVIKDSLTGSMAANLNYSGGSGSDTLIFGNSIPLQEGTKYYIEIDSGAIIDYYNHSFKGFTGKGNWSFSVTAVGIQNHSENSIFDIYPNPASNYVGIHFRQAIMNVKQINLFNAFGQCVYQLRGKQISTDSYNFSCTDLINGIYYCRVTTEKGVFVSRFAVQK